METSDEISESAGDDFELGTLLRASRIRRNEELRDVARELRIRFVYLQAIEDGRLDKLPGDTYAIGFIRTYSDYLGLDGDEIIRRFKIHGVIQNERTPLRFPAFLPGHSIPGVPLVIVGVLFAFVGYFSWYYSSTRITSVSEEVPPIPNKMVSLSAVNSESSKSPPNSEEVKYKAATASEPIAEDNSTKPNIKGPEFREGGPGLSSNKVELSDNPPTPNVAKPKKLKAEKMGLVDSQESTEPEPLEKKIQGSEKTFSDNSTPKFEEPRRTLGERNLIGSASARPEDENLVSVTAALRDAAIQRQTANRQAEDPKLKEDSNTASSLQAALDDNSADTLSALPERTIEVPASALPTGESVDKTIKVTTETIEPQDSSSLNAQPEINITAIDASWIQVRNVKENRVIESKVLLRGHTYKVPAGESLSLMTGNAGALKVYVDGKAVPSLGKVGEVRRKVILQAELLRQGNAVVD